MKGVIKIVGCSVIAVMIGLTTDAAATVIKFDTHHLTQNDYRYTYTVVNNGTLGVGVPITLFDIEFDPSLYLETSLAITTPSALQANWDEVIFPSVPGLPAVYDVLALAGGVSDGSSVSGFSIDFEWLGGGIPISQPFQIYRLDSATGQTSLLETGITLALNPTPTPEPGTLWAIILGFTVMTVVRMKRRA